MVCLRALFRVPARVATASAGIYSLLLLSPAPKFHSDVIYLANGNVLVVERAWEEDNEVKYRTGETVQSLAKSSVRRIQAQHPLPSLDGKVRKYGIAQESRPSQAPAPSNASVEVPTLRPAPAAVSKEALRQLKENLKADPADVQSKVQLVRALDALASLQSAQGDLAGARASLEEALALEKKNSAILFNLAATHFRTGNYRVAEDLLVACLEVERNDQDVHYLLGEAYYAQEKVSQAISQWNTALRLGPNPRISQRLAKARQESGVHNELGVLQSAHFILRYDRKVSDYRLGQQMLTTLEDLYRQLSVELTSRAPATVAVILYPDQTYFDVTQAPSWSGALFDGKIRVPTKGLGMVTPELTAVLAHELTHSFIRALPGSGCPSWFNEGVAQLQEGKTAAKHRKLLAQLHKENQLLSLQMMKGSFSGLPTNVASMAYLEGLGAVEHLTSKFGKSVVRNILDLMGQNYNFENAFRSITQQSIAEFEGSWHRSWGE